MRVTYAILISYRKCMGLKGGKGDYKNRHGLSKMGMASEKVTQKFGKIGLKMDIVTWSKTMLRKQTRYPPL